MKVTIDRRQSGGDAICVIDDSGIQILNEKIESLPEKDGIVIYDSNNILTYCTRFDEVQDTKRDDDEPSPRCTNAAHSEPRNRG